VAWFMQHRWSNGNSEALLSESGEAKGVTRALLDDMDKVRKPLILNHSCGGSEQSVDRRAGNG
jgi:hypothetical protein